MRFVVVNPHTQRTTQVNCADLCDAQLLADLKRNEVDHSIALPGLGVVVYEFSMFMSPDMQAYFTIGSRLYAGNAVLYAFNKSGATIDIVDWPAIAFLPNAEAVERCIELGLVQRPYIAVNGNLLWQWPNPAPKEIMP